MPHAEDEVCLGGREEARYEGIAACQEIQLKETPMTCTGVCRYHPCPDCVPEEHRASRMPEHMESVDPTFLDAVFKEFAPEDIREKEEN